MSLTSDSLAKIEGQKEYSNVHKARPIKVEFGHILNTRPIKVEFWHILNKGETTVEILPLFCYYTVLVTYMKKCV